MHVSYKLVKETFIWSYWLLCKGASINYIDKQEEGEGLPIVNDTT